MRLLRKTALLLLVLMASGLVAFGQTATGEVNGTTDSTGAIINGATARLINQATQIETRVSPKQNGNFTFVNLRESFKCQWLLTLGRTCPDKLI